MRRLVDGIVARRRLAARVGGAVGLVAFLASCATNAPQDTWQPKGPNAEKIDNLQQPIFAVAGIIGIIVFVAVVYAMWRYKDRGQPIPEQTHGKPALEITLTVIPALILAVVGAFTFRVIFDLARTDDTELVINVTGQQWWWEYDYPVQNEWGITQPIITSGQLVMPAGTKVLLRETSRDVIHSYWIPALNGKRDAVPGRIHTLRLEADEPYLRRAVHGVLRTLARQHAHGAVALSKEDFAAWVANQQAAYQRPPREHSPKKVSRCS